MKKIVTFLTALWLWGHYLQVVVVVKMQRNRQRLKQNLLISLQEELQEHISHIRVEQLLIF